MQTNEDLIKRIAENVALRLIRIYANGGGGSFTLPLAADGVRGGVQVGYTTDATARKYAVQLDGEKAYVNVPWTDHTYTLAGLVGDAAIGGSTQPIYWNGSSFVNTSYTLAKSVPSDAVFTDTDTWRPIGTGADDAAAGNHLHDDRYLKLSGGTMTGQLSINKVGYALKWNNDNYSVGSNNSPNDFYIWSEDSTARFRLGTNNLERLTVLANGNIGIGTQSPSYKLHVAGTIYATGSITERSDIRCKDVETYKWSPTLDMIADAPIIRYTMKDDKMHRMRVGSVAQYWEKVMPETVNKDNDGILSIAQGDICMVNIIALAREVRKLREEIIQLKKWA